MHSVKTYSYLKKHVGDALVLLEWCHMNAGDCAWWPDYERYDQWSIPILSRINFTDIEDAIAFRLKFGL